MTPWLRIAAQVLVLTLVTAGVAALADWPAYRQIPAGTAVVKLSFTHGASREADCRRRTPEELAKMPANMRKPLDCQRSRRSVYVELDLDGRTIYHASLAPSGLSSDGPSRVYQRFVVPAGAHAVAVRMRDTARTEGFDHTKSGAVTLAAEQNFVIDFRPEEGGFFFH